MKRTLQQLGFVAILSTTACTIEATDRGWNAEGHSPFQSSTWQSEHQVSATDARVCEITAGHNGLSVQVMRRGEASSYQVASTRRLRPGATLTAMMESHRFRTSQPHFTPQQSKELVDDFLSGHTAYLEWSEVRPSGRGRWTLPSILPASGFAEQLEACQRYLDGEP